MCETLLVALKNVKLETTNFELAKTCQHVLESLKNDTLKVDILIEKLSEFILNFDDVVLFKKYLPNLLLALVSSRIPLTAVFSNQNYGLCTDLEKTRHLEYSVVLGLLSDHPDILQYALKYFQINSIPPYDVFIHHEDSYNVAPKKRRLLDLRQKITDYHIVNCCYSLLSKLPNELSTKWDWTKFIINFSNHEDPKIRWMLKECMVILTNMTELQSHLLTENLKLTEDDNVQNIPYSKDIFIINGVNEELSVNTSNIVHIDGISLPVYDKTNIQPGKLVPVKSTLNNLRSLALAVASGQALSLLGPVGSGKTCLVEHLAAITGRKGIAFKKVQLGDQTDSRMLLGSHQCTDVPGEFVWSPGVLTEAVQNGHWLLLEDIDCAALDVASTLSSLLERNTLCVPGYRDSLPVTPGFQLFVTQRTVITNYGFQKKMSNSSTLLQKHLTQINVEPLSRIELAEIIQTKYPSLSTICSRMIEVFMMFSVGSHDASIHATSGSEKDSNYVVLRGSRLISTRDLMKWCARAVVEFNVSSPDSAIKVLEDALDIFTCSISSPENRLELAKKVGTYLGIVETKSEFYVKHYKPNVSLHPNVLEVGRAKVTRLEKSIETINLDNKQVVFSFTRQSACLLERIACCVNSNEPVLLVGETGTGKTSSIQYLARQTGHKLVVINMNQQSDSADLLGGYKPVDLKYVIRPIKNEYLKMFKGFYNVEKNQKFINHIDTCYDTENWTALMALMKQSHKAAVTRLTNEKNHDLLKIWLAFGHKLSKLEQQVKSASRLTFAFIEGSLVKAMQEGHWVLLDEINLASAEILECLAGLLEDKSESIDLLEKGDKVPIKRHPDFTLFACMNPATDVGKKDLPVGLRNRFTEFFIDELKERNDLMLLIGDYLYHMNLSGATLEAIYTFYSSIKKEAKLNLVDGAGNAPHYSLRTLCRALTAAAKAKCGTVARSLYEAFCLSFLTQLDRSSHPQVESMIAKAVMGKKNVNSILKQQIPEPKVEGQNYLLFEGHWIPQGKLPIDIPDGYILTPTVRKNLRDIARIISLGRLPVLLQGDTSVGKTSLITYIAKASGNYCVRINNHEHTDLQEYIGSYATDSSGSLVFKEGVLVEAMRKGYWIILDELNLAPSDVLEALNRVLDDNRELFIPETQEVVKADPNFMLFATQNPPGLYGGRKMLSRAFRNRFVELHFDEIPRIELETILHQRCHIPPTYCKRMIEVMAELQVRRRGSAAVQGKDGFITLRDLFRWGQRYKQASKEMLTTEKFYDWDQHIADEGYLILAGKVRQTDERNIIEEVLEKHIKRKVNPENLFSLHDKTSPVTKPILEMILSNQLDEFSHIVWTYNMRRLAVLIAKAFMFSEPVLLVGETGCGKTTICQVLASLSERKLLSVNCHMHTESSDFLGGLRPVRHYNNDGRLFEWVDGPLIKAMENGDLFLADEISLADDSVLERLNSLLEPERQLVISERGMEDSSEIVVITAVSNFHFIGTMNPGGDFGKKELSPALRNRFTEIWCDRVSSKEDLQKVLEKSVGKGIALGNQEDGSSGIGNCILDFTNWLKSSEVTNKFPFSIRDLLSWVQFINVTVSKGLLDVSEAYVHGACMTFLDCFGTTLTGHIESNTLLLLRENAINFLLNQIKTFVNEYTDSLKQTLSNKNVILNSETCNDKFGIKPFYIDCGPYKYVNDEAFTFTAPTTGSNTLRLLRGLQLNKAILLEGNPGVGKTSLVTALAKSSGHKVIRINLSDQTDITDLFGTDLPSEDGSFLFKEGAFLNALQNGDWILLDELNLAPQAVLEGLNACLDHRGEVFIPELGKTFKVKKETKLFACQNPLKQGGARRGLPVSFLNRFTQVYIDTLTKEDLLYIVKSQYYNLPEDVLNKIVEFNCKIAHEVCEVQTWGHKGGPWEMNLRDIQRWCEALIRDLDDGKGISPGKYVDMLYVNRMRTVEDKQRMIHSFDEIFCPAYPRSDSNPQIDIKEDVILIGDVTTKRNENKTFKNRRSVKTNLLLLRNQLPILKALAQNVNMKWLSLLVGPTATGKSSIVQVLADLTGNDLHVVPVTSTMDVSDLLGFFEQVDYNRNIENLYDETETATIQVARDIWIKQDTTEWKSNRLLSNLHQYKSFQYNSTDKKFTDDDIEVFSKKIKFLLEHCSKIQESAKLCHVSTNRVEKIVQNLMKLRNRVSNLSSVNAGGKFEWVDSLLVKAMVEGSWLLLDNVNLTSSAILDRLNGLLEPNGVLSVPERGEVREIKPHPEFRVFFTMDTKYGEISRAMRNRGVEIYLHRPDDSDLGLSEAMDYLDLVALLSSCGLPNQYHDICIRCHESMTAFIQGLEKPTVSHLLQAVYLTWQQMVRGISCKTALLNSFSDVYIKPRTCGDFSSSVNTSLAEMKNNMLKTLEFDLSAEKYEPIVRKDVSHTLTIKGLAIYSAFELTKQIAYLAIKQANAEISESTLYPLFSILTSYQKCPPELLEATHFIINQGIQKHNKGHLKSLTWNLNKGALEYFRGNLIADMYKRFLPEAYKLNEDDIYIANACIILLYIQLKDAELSATLKNTGFSALDYSNAVSERKLTDDFVDYPILKNCKAYLEVIDQYIENIIKSVGPALTDKAVCSILQLLNWRERLIKITSMPIFETSETKRTPILKEEIIPFLNVHSKWVQKYLLGGLFKLLGVKNVSKKFLIEMDKLNLNIAKDNSNVAKVSKKLRKYYGQPKLYKNQEEYDLCIAREKLYNQTNLDMNEPLDRQLSNISQINTSDMSLAYDVPNPETIDAFEEKLSSLPSKTNSAKLLSELKLLPINSYVIKRIINILQPHFLEIINKFADEDYEFENDIRFNTQEIMSSLIHLGKVLKGFPPAFLNQLQVIRTVLETNKELDNSISSLPVGFWIELNKMLISSPATYPLPFLKLNDLLNSEDRKEAIPLNTSRLSMNLSLMPFYIQNLTTCVDVSTSTTVMAYENVALKDRVDYSMQLQTVLNILWKNIGSLDSTAILKLKSDAIFEIKKYEQLIDCLSYIISENYTVNDTIVDICDVIIKEIQLYFKGDANIVDMLNKANDIYKQLMSAATDENYYMTDKTKILTAELSLLTSLLFLRIMAEISPIDHVEKYRLKVKYIEEDVDIFNKLLSVYYMHGVISGGISENRKIEKISEVTADCFKQGTENREKLKKVHPYCEYIMNLKEETALRVHKYASGNTFRPKEPSYNSFIKDCKHFTKSILSDRSVKIVYKNLLSTCDAMYDIVRSGSHEKALKQIQNAQTVLTETTSWLHSVKAFSKRIDSYSEAFPDLAKPLQSSISQIMCSVISLNDLIREYVAKIELGPFLPKMLTSLLVYPNNIPSLASREKHLNRYLSPNFMQLLNRNTVSDDMSQPEREYLEVLKMSLSEFGMHGLSMERIDRISFKAVLTTLNAITKSWEKQRQDIEKQKQDEEALYVTKSKCEDEDEDAQAQEEIMEMFPSYSDSDFAEFKPPTLEQRKIKPTTVKPKLLLSADDVSLIYKWHSNFVRNLTNAQWLTIPKKLVTNDVVRPLLLRYPTFSRVIQGAWEALDVNFEGIMLPSLMVLVSNIKHKVDGISESSQKVDFYRSPWISETRECLPLLERVKESTNELLDQWPDFPTLKDIIVIVDRIIGFPITSPVSRFLTGLELLRDKIEEWNKNAHKGNNMIDISLAVGQQIINWRKLEMSHWKECLNNVYQRKQAEAHQYWFYMYAVIKSYLDDSELSSARVVSVLKEFMEKSNLAEFEVRLDIVYVYHCHLIHMDASQRRNELLSLLWNTYNYYGQFSPQVASHIKEKRAPIEKKLKDFVKICTWDRDLSYWSVKDTVEKAHKALHKHTKEFEKVLKESVASCLVDTASESIDHVGIWDRPKRAGTASNAAGGAYMIDLQNHVVLNRNIKKYLDQLEQPCPLIQDGSLLSKIPSLLNKARSLCKDTIANTGYPALVQGLDDFVTLVIETSEHLVSLEVDSTLPKDKQKSQAKNITQQKRKALADLFKHLSKIGLNYRTGLVIISASDDMYDFTIPPVDLDAAMSYLKSRRCDPTLALLWSGCEKYFQKNIARHRLLSAALQSPHPDLGIQNIERCKGFAAHLLKYTNTQKKSISRYSRHIFDLRTVATGLTNALEIDATGCNVTSLENKLNILVECYAHTSILLEQFNVVLISVPEKHLNTDSEPNFDKVLSNSPLADCFKDTDEWKCLYKKIKSVISLVGNQKAILNKLPRNPKQIDDSVKLPIISQSHIEAAKEAKNNLNVVIEKCEEIITEYQFVFKTTIIEDFTPRHPILRSLENMVAYVRDVQIELAKLDEPIDQEMDENSGNILEQTEDVVATMLLVIQSLYKKHLPPQKQAENIDVKNAINEIIDEGEKVESKEILEDNHLKELLQEKISTDSRMLQLETLVTKMRQLLINYLQHIATRSDVEEVRTIVMRLVPILEQVILFVQYFVSQKVAVHRVSCKMLLVLLKIFLDLASKGFCKHSELDSEEGEGEGSTGASGMGLGEGEGQKDVSERIENQDQLDDAHKPGEEKNEEDRDCKEEEKGVNMTDDFDSHLQDVEQKEQSDEENDNDDPDKQMGDTDNAAEKLDQQIWGSEDEEDLEEEQNKKDKEERGKGESTGEKEMGAKEEEQGQDDGTEGKEKKKKDINEMEPEVDDDHVDPYHGKQQELPEPEDFEMPENLDLDGEEKEDKEGETETENPFEIDAMKEAIQEEEEKKENDDDKGNKNGLEVSSDEEGDGNDDEQTKESYETEPDKDDENGDNKDEETETPEETGDDETQPDTNNPETEPEKQDESEKELPKNPDEITKDEEKEETNQDPNPNADPANRDPSAEDKVENAEMEKGTNDNVQMNTEPVNDDDAAPYEQLQEQVGENVQSTGRSELDKSDKGHKGDKQATRSEAREERTKYENKPGKTDQDRSLGDINQKKQKQVHTLEAEQDGGDDTEQTDEQADAYQHVKEANKDDIQVIDAATKEQADEQPTLREDDDAEELKDDEVPMDVDDDDITVEKSEEMKPEKMKESKSKDENKPGDKKDGEETTGETGFEIDGATVMTETVPRGRDTTYHTKLQETSQQAEDITMQEYMSLREWLESVSCDGSGSTSAAWRSVWTQSSVAARALCERLRLVLEPTGRSRRAGDFRTGRAINMRRVIPYIASHFRKDRIWLRRTKPAKREYKIAIAIDDSSSMSDNRSKELAFESLALVSQALNLLESGDLAVLSFGEKPNLLHPFTEQFSEHSGSKILERLRFEQNKTKIAQLLDFCTVMFDQLSMRSDALNAKLLVIVSDGRGIFSEGEARVVQAVRRARQQGIFIVYVIIDNPDNKDSIMDIRKPIIDPVSNSLSGFVPYLDTFPFPFYLILRDMNALPTVLGDALRQWFELAANTSN